VQNNNYFVCKAVAIEHAVDNEDPDFTTPALKPITGKAFNPKRKNTILFCKSLFPWNPCPMRLRADLSMLEVAEKFFAGLKKRINLSPLLQSFKNTNHEQSRIDRESIR
jgi:hypothetical protein